MDKPLEETPQILLHDTEKAFRWIHKHAAEFRADGSFKKLRPLSFPLKQTDAEGISLFAERFISEQESIAKACDEVKSGKEYVGQVTITVAALRAHSLDLAQVIEKGEEAHFHVVGYEAMSQELLNDIRRKLVQVAQPTYKPLEC